MPGVGLVRDFGKLDGTWFMGAGTSVMGRQDQPPFPPPDLSGYPGQGRSQ